MTVIDRDKLEASKDLVEFLSKCCELLELQISSVGTVLETTVLEVMEEIRSLSMITEDARKTAESAIEETFLDPSNETRQFIDSIQSYVDDLVEGKEVASDLDDLVQKNITRFGGRFVKHMEAISNLDDNVREALMVMMAALSVDDKVAQRLEHLNHCVQAFKMFLSYLLIDFENRSDPEKVKLLIEDLESFSWRVYSSNEERDLHVEVFGEAFGRKMAPLKPDKAS